MYRPLMIAALLAAPGFYVTNAHAEVIDLFSDPPGTEVAPQQEVTSEAVVASPPDTEPGKPLVSDPKDAGLENYSFDEHPGSSAGSNSILGGYRDLLVAVTGYLEVPGQPQNPYEGSSSTMVVKNSSLQFNNEAGVESIGRVQWDGNDNSPFLDYEGLQGIDLENQVGCPDDGCDRFIAEVFFTDLGLSYNLGLYTDADNYAILAADALFSVDSPRDEPFLFEWFTFESGDYFQGGLPFTITRVGRGPDLNDIGAIELVLFSQPSTGAGSSISVDLALGSLTKTGPEGPVPPVVPEPGTLALLGLGALGFALGSRRRKAVCGANGV